MDPVPDRMAFVPISPCFKPVIRPFMDAGKSETVREGQYINGKRKIKSPAKMTIEGLSLCVLRAM